MSKEPEITVIIPVYNGANTIAESIQSILDQTCQDWQILIVNDHCTDNTLAVVAQFAEPRIQVLTPPHRIGNGEASKAYGIEQARLQGQPKYISFLDQDDYYHPEKLSLQKKHLDENPDYLAVVNGMYYMDPEGLVFISKPSLKPFPEAYDLLQGNHVVPHFQSYLFRSELFDDLTLESISLSDSPLILETLLRFPGRIYALPQVLWFYRIHPNSTVNNPQNLKVCQESAEIYRRNIALGEKYQVPLKLISRSISADIINRNRVFMSGHNLTGVFTMLGFAYQLRRHIMLKDTAYLYAHLAYTMMRYSLKTLLPQGMRRQLSSAKRWLRNARGRSPSPALEIQEETRKEMVLYKPNPKMQEAAVSRHLG